MKRLKTAIAILLLIPVFIVGIQIYLHRVTDSMRALVTQAEQLNDAGQTEKAGKMVLSFQKKWQKNRQVLAVFIRHSELDPVNLSSARLSAYLRHDQTGEFDAEIGSLSVQLHHLWESERFSLDNIL